MRDGKHVILCVDDDPDVLHSLRLILETAGYHVATAATADEGRVAVQQAQPDLLIVDLMMEDVDSGFTLVKRLRAEGLTAPVYFLSSSGDYLYETTDVGRFGAEGVFQKPLAPDRLLSVVAARLRAAVGSSPTG
jgi:DNA-binding response OmpR family regulator